MKTIAEILGKKIARDIFSCADERERICTRIQFMSGTWPDNETSLGGFVEEPFARAIAESIRKHMGE